MKKKIYIPILLGTLANSFIILTAKKVTAILLVDIIQVAVCIFTIVLLQMNKERTLLMNHEIRQQKQSNQNHVQELTTETSMMKKSNPISEKTTQIQSYGDKIINTTPYEK